MTKIKSSLKMTFYNEIKIVPKNKSYFFLDEINTLSHKIIILG